MLEDRIRDDVSGFFFDPVSPSMVYVGTDAGFFVSTDNGSSWTPMNVGLTIPVINALVRAPGPGGSLYAATKGAGVFVLSTEPENRDPVNRVGGHGSPRVVRRP